MSPNSTHRLTIGNSSQNKFIKSNQIKMRTVSNQSRLTGGLPETKRIHQIKKQRKKNVRQSRNSTKTLAMVGESVEGFESGDGESDE